MRSFLIRGVSALAILGALAFSNRAMADINLDTPNVLYSANYYGNNAVQAINSDTVGPNSVSAFMTANGGTLSSLTTAASGNGTPLAFTPVLIPGPAFPVFPGGPWMANGPNSSWIGPTSVGASTPAMAPYTIANGFNPANSAPQGFFAYTISFSLSGAPSFSGLQWASDNQGVAIYLNGTNEHDSFGSAGSFTAFTAFTLNAVDLKPVGQTNTLTFVVFNEEYQPVHESPTGIRIEGSITSLVATPEPATVAMAASALPIVLVGAWVRRRRSAV